jgi:hypothetical protein
MTGVLTAAIHPFEAAFLGRIGSRVVTDVQISKA